VKKFYSGDLKERDHLGDIDLDERVTLKLTSNKDGVRIRTRFI
jgi:hypothetical protein